MHELAITQGVVDAVTARTGTARVAAVTVRVGRLSGVVPDAMRFCFDLVTESTPLAGARLDIEQPEGRARCRDCVGLSDPVAAAVDVAADTVLELLTRSAPQAVGS
ncbi:MAG: hydrogenase maturation nickel metallochaperone HypA [Nocardioidaceae bacterium]|nr:hydrogenase maturation nickel metallochaperone HypA [Nocardioidaceae bacterium]